MYLPTRWSQWMSCLQVGKWDAPWVIHISQTLTPQSLNCRKSRFVAWTVGSGRLRAGSWMTASCVRSLMDALFITHAPLFRGGAAYIYESPLGDACLVMNIHNPFVHCVTSQYVFKPRDVIMLNNRINIATITYATASPCRVPLNGMFHQDPAMQWNKLQIEMISNFVESNSFRQAPSQFRLDTTCMW